MGISLDEHYYILLLLFDYIIPCLIQGYFYFSYFSLVRLFLYFVDAGRFVWLHLLCSVNI